MAISNRDVLTVWERAQAAHPAARGVALLAAADPQTDPAALLRAPIGSIDSAVLAWREQWLGRSMTALADCPHCGVRVELDVDSSEQTAGLQPPQVFAVVAGELQLQCRLPAPADLVAVASCLDEESARAMLIRRCIVDGEIGEVTPELASVVAEAMAAADPDGGRGVDVLCPECGAAWNAAFDPAAFVWSELEAAVVRAFREVHLLASAYGWSEDAVLAMTPQRRRMYLAMVSG
ncbi:MAG: hypothetical protein ACXW5U_05050 [Thermoanaerobaculia bacterium]